MYYKFYTTSDKAWVGIIVAINQAQKTIYIEMYIFLGDTRQTHDFLGILKAKALAGLEVVIVLDAYGSSELKPISIQDLRMAGVELLFFSHWLRRTHRKLVIIDSKIAFIGGVNIENKIRKWQDLHMRLRGKIIKPLVRSFAYTYQQCDGKKNNILKQSSLPLVKKIKSWVIDTWEVGEKKYRLNNYYLEKLVEAKTSIKIITPYLLPPRWLIRALDDAIRKGVKVEIIIPENTDIKVLNKINYFNACRLASIGIEFYFISSMNHAKVMLIDEREALVGSQNLDILSFGINAEIGVFFQQKQAIASLIKIIDKWQAESRQLDLSFKRLSFTQRILMFIFKIFLSFF
jgi:cardiolipin synthase